LRTQLIGTISQDSGKIVAVDQNGNIFVTEHTFGILNGITNNGNMDSFLVKFDSNGVSLWTKLIGTPGMDKGPDVAVNQNGNIFFTGNSDRDLNGQTYNGGANDSFLVKYNYYEELIWTKMIGE